MSTVLYKNVYINEKIYNELGNKQIINTWITTRQYQIRGVVYPFIYSSRNTFMQAPDGYNKNEAKAILNNYKTADIPSEKKVNIISIMLEAYNDFSKYDSIEFLEDIYAPLRKIKNESYSGNLVTTVFGAGTSVTERNFLTGYTLLPNFRRKTDTFIQYFREQGYYTEAMHPIYGAFYNRNTANANIGFDKYLNYENTFKEISEDFLSDDMFFDEIIKGYENSIKNNQPYFNFSVTYQNHGPYYDGYYTDKLYFISNLGYSDSTYNVVNEYFRGIKNTNLALEKLINYFKKEEEPVVVVFFGDHNPYWGAENTAYSELGINLDLDTIEGYENYYETPFVIWSNNAAKDVINSNFDKSSNKISPQFLMSELFEYIGIEGSEYMQYMTNLKNETPVVNDSYYLINNEFVNCESYDNSKMKNEYLYLNYYMISKK